jgi:hypothetical protein
MFEIIVLHISGPFNSRQHPGNTSSSSVELTSVVAPLHGKNTRKANSK